MEDRETRRFVLVILGMGCGLCLAAPLYGDREFAKEILDAGKFIVSASLGGAVFGASRGGQQENVIMGDAQPQQVFLPEDR